MAESQSGSMHTGLASRGVSCCSHPSKLQPAVLETPDVGSRLWNNLNTGGSARNIFAGLSTHSHKGKLRPKFELKFVPLEIMLAANAAKFGEVILRLGSRAGWHFF